MLVEADLLDAVRIEEHLGPDSEIHGVLALSPRSHPRRRVLANHWAHSEPALPATSGPGLDAFHAGAAKGRGDVHLAGRYLEPRLVASHPGHHAAWQP